MGWLPSLFYRQVNALRLWNRILNMNSERLTKKIFLSDYGSNSGWCQESKLLFETLDMKDIFENLHLCDINLATVNLRGNFETKWKIEVNKKPKLRTYKIFKTSFETYEYIKWNLEKSDRSLLAQFMCGILQLRVESGRFMSFIFYVSVLFTQTFAMICT